MARKYLYLAVLVVWLSLSIPWPFVAGSVLGYAKELAAAPPPWSVKTPPGVIEFEALVIENREPVPTPSPFQQMVNLSSSNPLWAELNTAEGHFGQNVVFFYPNGTVIPSWLEGVYGGRQSYAIWWVKLGAIPANGSVVICVGVGPRAQNYYARYNGTVGEAPQLSPVYGEYDSGSSVFIHYWNFASSHAPDGISVYISNGSVAFGDGVHIVGGTNRQPGENGISTPPVPMNCVVDFYGQMTSNVKDVGYAVNWIGFSNYLGSSANFPWGGGKFAGFISKGNQSFPVTNVLQTIKWWLGSTPKDNYVPDPSFHVFTVGFLPYTRSPDYAFEAIVDYGKTNLGGLTVAPSVLGHLPPLPFAIIQGNGEGLLAPEGQTIYWLRVRAPPPDGVMPSVAFVGGQYIQPVFAALYGIVLYIVVLLMRQSLNSLLQRTRRVIRDHPGAPLIITGAVLAVTSAALQHDPWSTAALPYFIAIRGYAEIAAGFFIEISLSRKS
ncbi:MAG: hypothetical protein RXS42_07145 [Nitrososphaeria archaeon]